MDNASEVYHDVSPEKYQPDSVLCDLGRRFDELVIKEVLAYQFDEQSLGLDYEILDRLNEVQDAIAELTANILRITPRTKAEWAVQSRVRAYWHGELTF